MALTNQQKFVIGKILSESLDKKQMMNEYNLFFSGTGDPAGAAGWKILKKHTDGKEKYQGFIGRFPDTAETQREVGEFVREEMKHWMGT